MANTLPTKTVQNMLEITYWKFVFFLVYWSIFEMSVSVATRRRARQVRCLLHLVARTEINDFFTGSKAALSSTEIAVHYVLEVFFSWAKRPDHENLITIWCWFSAYLEKHHHFHICWGRLSLWKWVPGISPGVKAAGAFGWRPTTLLVPKVEEIRALTYPEPLGPPRPVAGYLYFLLPHMSLSCGTELKKLVILISLFRRKIFARIFLTVFAGSAILRVKWSPLAYQATCII